MDGESEGADLVLVLSLDTDIELPFRATTDLQLLLQAGVELPQKLTTTVEIEVNP